jgi:hypothetical protein
MGSFSDQEATMKRFWVGGGVVLTLLLTGCNDSTTLTPGDPNDPSFQSFQDGFGDLQTATNSMSNAAFNIMGDVVNGNTAKPIFQGITYTLVYNETAQFWVAHLVLDNDAGSVASFTDSVQFVANGSPVKYPSLPELDYARSFLTMSAEGPEGSATGFQNIVATPSLVDSTITVAVNGTGGLEGSFTHSRTDSTGTTDCVLNAAFSSTYNHLVWDVTHGTEGHCPLSGSFIHTGDLHVVCTGAHPGDAEKHWTVTATFENGTGTVSVVSGDNVWHFPATCE